MTAATIMDGPATDGRSRALPASGAPSPADPPALAGAQPAQEQEPGSTDAQLDHTEPAHANDGMQSSKLPLAPEEREKRQPDSSPRASQRDKRPEAQAASTSEMSPHTESKSNPEGEAEAGTESASVPQPFTSKPCSEVTLGESNTPSEQLHPHPYAGAPTQEREREAQRLPQGQQNRKLLIISSQGDRAQQEEADRAQMAEADSRAQAALVDQDSGTVRPEHVIDMYKRAGHFDQMRRELWTRFLSRPALQVKLRSELQTQIQQYIASSPEYQAGASLKRTGWEKQLADQVAQMSGVKAAMQRIWQQVVQPCEPVAPFSTTSPPPPPLEPLIPPAGSGSGPGSTEDPSYPEHPAPEFPQVRQDGPGQQIGLNDALPDLFAPQGRDMLRIRHQVRAMAQQLQQTQPILPATTTVPSEPEPARSAPAPDVHGRPVKEATPAPSQSPPTPAGISNHATPDTAVSPEEATDGASVSRPKPLGGRPPPLGGHQGIRRGRFAPYGSRGGRSQRGGDRRQEWRESTWRRGR